MNKVFYERPDNSRKQQNKKKQYKNLNVSFEKTVQEPEQTQADQRESKNNSIKELIANAAIVVLSIGLVISMMILLTEVHYMDYGYAHDEDSFWYNIEDGRYGQIVRNRWMNEFEDVKVTEGLKQCYAVADYFEAASFYKAAIDNGNMQLAEKYALKMEEAYTYFYDITYIAEDIHNKLGLETERD